jgi:hypothetical protein
MFIKKKVFMFMTFSVKKYIYFLFYYCLVARLHTFYYYNNACKLRTVFFYFNVFINIIDTNICDFCNKKNYDFQIVTNNVFFFNYMNNIANIKFILIFLVTVTIKKLILFSILFQYRYAWYINESAKVIGDTLMHFQSFLKNILLMKFL